MSHFYFKILTLNKNVYFAGLSIVTLWSTWNGIYLNGRLIIYLLTILFTQKNFAEYQLSASYSPKYWSFRAKRFTLLGIEAPWK